MGAKRSTHTPLNVVVLRGTLSSDPEDRTLPSGDALVAYQVRIERPDGPADSVPVVWSDPRAADLTVAAGDHVVVVGRVRRRFFRSGGRTASTTEVVADRVVSGGGAPARRAIEQCLDALT